MKLNHKASQKQFYIFLFFITVVVILMLIIIWWIQSHRNCYLREDFYTLFQPYYYPDTIQTYSAYTNNNRIIGLEKIFLNLMITPQLINTYNAVNFGGTNRLHLFLKSLIAFRYPMTKINLIAEGGKNQRKILSELIRGTEGGPDLAVVSGPILANIGDKNWDKLEYLTSLNQQYVFILAPVNRNIDVYTDLQGRRIGIGKEGGLWEQCAKDLLDFEYIAYHGELRETLEKIYNKEIDAMLITDIYPSPLLNFIIYNFYDLRLIALNNVENKSFYYEKIKVDLNQITAMYLPQASFFEKNTSWIKARLMNNESRPMMNYYSSFNQPLKSWMNPYYQDFLTFRFSNYLICKKGGRVSKRVGKMLVEHIFNNKKLLEKSPNTFTFIPIDLNSGAREYYLKKRYLTEYDGKYKDNCIYLYGKNECNQQNLREKELVKGNKYYNLLV